MTDLAKVAESTAKLIDALERDTDQGDHIGEILLIAEVVKPETDDEPEMSYIQFHCSSGRFLIQKGLIAWAYAAMVNDASRMTPEDEEE
jgi:hypothetical protein